MLSSVWWQRLEGIGFDFSSGLGSGQATGLPASALIVAERARKRQNQPPARAVEIAQLPATESWDAMVERHRQWVVRVVCVLC